MKADDTIAQDLIALSLVPGAGRRTVHRALQLAHRQGIRLGALFGLPMVELLRLTAAGEEHLARSLHGCGMAQRERAAWLLQLAAEHGIRHVTCEDPAYPPFIATDLAPQAPPLLFFQGNEALLQARGAAVVGTRRPTQEAREWARAAAGVIAGEGITLVSGGAGGIDLEAHEAALTADGSTVVVLPEGLHAHQPRAMIRTGLQNGQVLLLSEFLPTGDWQTHRAMTRNRTIAAFSRTVVVVEPRATGGSMYTAEQALSQGKPVFFWGGACRDGALSGRAGAVPLVRAGKLDGGRLRRAVLDTSPQPARQADFFE